MATAAAAATLPGGGRGGGGSGAAAAILTTTNAASLATETTVSGAGQCIPGSQSEAPAALQRGAEGRLRTRAAEAQGTPVLAGGESGIGRWSRSEVYLSFYEDVFVVGLRVMKVSEMQNL